VRKKEELAKMEDRYAADEGNYCYSLMCGGTYMIL
jgi:hypothetical protein